MEKTWNGTDVVEHGAVREQPTALNDITHLAAQRGLALERSGVPSQVMRPDVGSNISV